VCVCVCVCVCVYSYVLGDCIFYKLTGFTESSGFKLTVSGSSPGSFDVGHSILCSVFSTSSIFQYSYLLLFLYFTSFVDSQDTYILCDHGQ